MFFLRDFCGGFLQLNIDGRFGDRSTAEFSGWLIFSAVHSGGMPTTLAGKDDAVTVVPFLVFTSRGQTRIMLPAEAVRVFRNRPFGGGRVKTSFWSQPV